MSSIFDSIHSWNFKPYRRMGVTIDEEIFYAKMLSKYVESLSPSKILEIGCGNGIFSLTLKKTFPKLDLLSLDLWNDEMRIPEVKGYLSEVDSNMVQNLFPLPTRDSYFDVVYAPLYFYNLPRSRRDEAASEVVRVIKPGGYLILIDLEIVRNMRNSFQKVGLIEKDYHVAQGVFFSLLQKGEKY
ncbi:methyltransferase type 11 [Candidatus Acidianus copahuensis]|uniref:Methyltransferase type 11 n=1 Tax=Candidatus Acidianus copahuensis TaxID=1160895 RepID=A0A031LP15_9CREN|nr:class I SAM-dependent methyltransferase [Candidatus Acidianus copahuensis]EZQ04909.1 methyltransferase type 11 [Candidatus Acidianus copahuensis]